MKACTSKEENTVAAIFKDFLPSQMFLLFGRLLQKKIFCSHHAVRMKVLITSNLCVCKDIILYTLCSNNAYLYFNILRMEIPLKNYKD